MPRLLIQCMPSLRGRRRHRALGHGVRERHTAAGAKRNARDRRTIGPTCCCAPLWWAASRPAVGSSAVARLHHLGLARGCESLLSQSPYHVLGTLGGLVDAFSKLLPSSEELLVFLFFFFFKYKNQGECFCPDARRGPCARAWGVPPGQPLFRWARGLERVVGGRAGVVSQAACGSGGCARGAAPLAEGQARHAASSVWRRADGAQRDGDAAQHRGRLGGGDDGQGHGRCQPGGRGALGLPRRPRLWHRHARRAEAAHSQGAGAAVEAPNRGCARALDASGGGRLSERGGAVAAGAARRGARRAARGARGAVSDLEAAR